MLANLLQDFPREAFTNVVGVTMYNVDLSGMPNNGLHNFSNITAYDFDNTNLSEIPQIYYPARNTVTKRLVMTDS